MIKKNSFLVNKTELNFHTYVNKILKILFWIKTKEIISLVHINQGTYYTKSLSSYKSSQLERDQKFELILIKSIGLIL